MAKRGALPAEILSLRVGTEITSQELAARVGATNSAAGQALVKARRSGVVDRSRKDGNTVVYIRTKITDKVHDEKVKPSGRPAGRTAAVRDQVAEQHEANVGVLWEDDERMLLDRGPAGVWFAHRVH